MFLKWLKQIIVTKDFIKNKSNEIVVNKEFEIATYNFLNNEKNYFFNLYIGFNFDLNTIK